MPGTITVVGLGAGSMEQLPLGVWRLFADAPTVLLRTRNHPVVPELEREGVCFESFDHLYEQHDTFEAVYEAIVAELFRRVEAGDRVLYAVPGHPLVAERTVQLLLTEGPGRGVTIDIKGGQSFLDPVFARLAIDPIDGFSLLDATSLRVDQLNPDLHTVIAQVFDRMVASDVKLTLMEVYPDEYPVTVATAVGVPGLERVVTLPLYELDRVDHMNNLTLVYVPPTREDAVRNRRFFRLKEIVAILRSPEGCPWDREQTHQSIRKHLLEEAYEVAETIDDDDPDAMCEELGDLLLQIMLHAQMASEEGTFTVEDVIAGLNEKLIRRHPHVFGDRVAQNADDALVNWEAIKAEEKAQKGEKRPPSVLDGIPRSLPALLSAYKLQKKAAGVGFDWDHLDDVYRKVEEEFQELRSAAPEERAGELGDLLFAVVNLARFLKIDPEEALVLTNRKFKQRFTYIEEKLRESGRTFEETHLAEMDKWWEEAKRLP